MLLPLYRNQSGPTEQVTQGGIPFFKFAKNLADSVAPDTSATGTETTADISPLDQDPFCEAPNFIESQIPFWLVQNYSSTGESYLIEFLKSYYNWLYCGFRKEDIKLTPYDIEMALDVDQTPDVFLDYFVKTYCPTIELESEKLQRQNLRKFLNNIKTKFLSSKGTKASYQYLLSTLFDITVEKISYPKYGLLRLNGGSFIGINTSVYQIFTTESLYSAGTITNLPTPDRIHYGFPKLGLNLGVINDNNFWQDYSYLLQTTATAQEAVYYSNTVLNTVHPAGTKAFFEQYVPLTPIDFGTADDNTDSVVISPLPRELPAIQNYLPYYPNYSFVIGGITLCSCCTSYCSPSGATAQYVTDLDPRWSESISDTTVYFKDITIGDFLELYPIENSPNITTSCSGCT